MMVSYIIGIDVGGTNTDVAITQQSSVVGWSKATTTVKIVDGVIKGILAAKENCEENRLSHVFENTKRVNIGTTQFINAVIKRENLEKVACIRLCGDASLSLPPFCDFPNDLNELVNGGYYLLQGGFEFNGKVVNDIDKNEILNVLKEVNKKGIHHVAVTGIFSPAYKEQEVIVGELIKQNFPHVTYTLSYELGQLGLLERESATILNESLKRLCHRTLKGFKQELAKIGLTCPIYFTQNDGTLLSEDQILNFPVYTFSSGATNSMRGAAFLSQQKDAIIVDIGGTSTDIGVLKNGFPREASTRIRIGGVNTNFRMPDTKSIGLGGGSIIKLDGNQVLDIGPESVEYRIVHEALVFGGRTLVATDIAVAAGITELGDKMKVAHLEASLVKKAMEILRTKVEDTIDTMKIAHEDCPVVLVGGGSILIDERQPLIGASKLIKPKFYQVANAVGAAFCQVSGSIDKMVAFDQPREALLAQAKEEAIAIALSKGAIPKTIQTVDISEIELPYIDVPSLRIKVKVVGDLGDTKNTEKVANEDKLIVQEEDKNKESNITNNSEILSNTSTDEICARQNEDSKAIQVNEVEQTAYKPEINEFGEWVVSMHDVDCLTIGAGILGCGGGGSPYLGWLGLKQYLKQGKQPRIMHIDRLKDDDLVYAVAFMGAPSIIVERLANGSELSNALQLAQHLSDMGFKVNQTNDELQDIANKSNIEIHFNEERNNAFINFITADGRKKPDAILCLEIGGLNSIEPLIVASNLDIPVLDCDGMGRAYPTLSQFAPFMYGVPPPPTVIVDHHGNAFGCVKSDTAAHLEEYLREHCVKMGCSAGVGIGPLSKSVLMKSTCRNTMSQSWYIGNAIMKARKEHVCPVKTLVQEANGKLLFNGKIIDVNRTTREGFTFGSVIIEGIEEYKSQENVIIDYKNEFLIVHQNNYQKMLASTPDLISLVATDTGEPITTDEIKYGLRVSVVILPASPVIKSKEALEFTSPKAFGFECEYTSTISYSPVESILRKD